MSAGAIAALVGAECVSPARLRLWLQHHDADDVLERLRHGRPLHPMCFRGLRGDAVKALRTKIAATSVDEMLERCHRLGVSIIVVGDADYPAALACDAEAPVALFVRGSIESLAGRRVGIVGTRHASAAGRATATELGRGLADEGIAVVSGLARGIDAAAHVGVRSSSGHANAVAVVGSGPDVHYPKVNATLWEWVAVHGALISEWPPGIRPAAFRFPLRNRIIAALSEALVVVESRERGGSLITAVAAGERGITVMAVPGSPRSRASAGTNQLLSDGATPVMSVDDVLVALSLDHRRAGTSPADPRRPPGARESLVLAVCSAEPSNLEMIVSETGLPIGEAALAAARLERDGWLIEAGGWFEPLGSLLGR